MWDFIHRLVGIVGGFLGLVSVAVSPTPIPTPLESPLAVVASVSASPSLTPTPPKTPTPAPTTIEEVAQQLQDLKKDLEAWTPEPTPTPQVIYVTVTPTPRPKIIKTPTPTPSKINVPIPVYYDSQNSFRISGRNLTVTSFTIESDNPSDDVEVTISPLGMPTLKVGKISSSSSTFFVHAKASPINNLYYFYMGLNEHKEHYYLTGITFEDYRNEHYIAVNGEGGNTFRWEITTNLQ